MDLPGNGNWISCDEIPAKGVQNSYESGGYIWSTWKSRECILYILWQKRDKSKSLGVHDNSVPYTVILWCFHVWSPLRRFLYKKNCSCLQHDLLEALTMGNPSNPVHTPSGWDRTHSLKHSCRTLGKVNPVNFNPDMLLRYFVSKIHFVCMCLMLWNSLKSTISGILTDSYLSILTTQKTLACPSV